MKIIILEEKTLAGITGRESQPQAISAIGLDPRGTETVAIGLDMDIPCLRGLRQNTRDPGREGRTHNQNHQRRQAANGRIPGFRGRRFSLVVKKVRVVPQM